MKITKAIIPAAGLGTRFLPATKAQPKEMLPIVDKPAIQYIVEEAVQSGITDIMIVTGRGKRAIEDHFDKSYELEELLFRRKNYDRLEEVQTISSLANIHYIRQKEPKGLGHAIWCARSFIGEEPFAVLLGDDIVDAEVPCTKQLMNLYENWLSPIIGVQEVPLQEVEKYGIVTPRMSSQHYMIQEIAHLVEKPCVEKAMSNLAIMGRYILTPEIFPILGQLSEDGNGEIQLTDAINVLNKQQKVYAYPFEGVRYDIGDKLGFIKATLEFALRRPELRSQVLKIFKEIL